MNNTNLYDTKDPSISPSLSIASIHQNYGNSTNIDLELPDHDINTKEIKNPWTKDIEDYVRKIGETCIKHKNLHAEKSAKYMLKYNRLMYTSMIIGPLVGMLSAINITINDPIFIPIVILCISFLNGILLSIIKFRRLDEASMLHKASSAKYLSLASNAKRQLSLDQKNREDSDDYLKWITHTLNTIFLNSPIVTYDSDKDLEEIIFTNKIRAQEQKRDFQDGILNYELRRFFNNDY
jgi:hypothetical protein